MVGAWSCGAYLAHAAPLKDADSCTSGADLFKLVIRMPVTIIEETEIHYLTRKPAAGLGRQRVLYIHGTGCNGRVFERHMDVLGSDHEVVAIDLPGHGASAGNGFRGVADHAAICAGLIHDLGWDRCVVAGHSLGGGIALALAIYDAELVQALMLIDTGARLRVAPEIIRGARAIAQGTGDAPTNPRLGFAASTPDSIVEGVRQLTADCRAEVTVKDWIADDTCDFMSRVATINVPTLAICGREDQLTPLRNHTFFQERMADCTLKIIEQAGHWPYAEQPGIFDGHVSEFLAGLN